MLRLNRKHLRLHLLALLQDFGGMLHALGPAQIADMHQSIDAVFDLDEGTEIGKVANLAFDYAADRIFLVQLLPRILLELLESKRTAVLRWVHVERNGLNLRSWHHYFRWALHA